MKKSKILKIVISLLVFFVLVLTFFLNSNSNLEITEKEAKDEIIKQYQTLESNTLLGNSSVVLDYQKMFNNSSIVGELYIPNTELKVPVAQGEDNDYYLNHLLDKSYNTLGSVFLDYRNNVDDKKIIIYGHNSQDITTEFHMLENYLDYDYYKRYSDIYFETINNKYHYKIFSVYIATNDYQHVNLKLFDASYQKHLDWLLQQSIYDTGVLVNRDDDILILQTCYFEPKDSFLIIAAKKI